jgi:hypothetical protein
VETSKDVKPKAVLKCVMIMGRTFRPLLKLAAKWITENSNRRRIKEKKSSINVGIHRKIR